MDSISKGKLNTSPTESMYQELQNLINIVAQLRAPDGCPWDREQTHQSIRGKLLEEAYEVMDAISKRDMDNLQEELGDLLLHILLHCQMAFEQNHFNFYHVMQTLSQKLIRRHPHVFGNNKLENAQQVTLSWEKIKEQEKKHKNQRATTNAFQDIPRSLDPLLKSVKIGKIAAKYDFDWPDQTSLWDKVNEELRELQEAADDKSDSNQKQARLKEEFGDLLFTLGQWARHNHIDPADALFCANRKFSQRFNAMLDKIEIDQNDRTEQKKSRTDSLKERGHKFSLLSSDQKEELWHLVKETI